MIPVRIAVVVVALLIPVAATAMWVRSADARLAESSAAPSTEAAPRALLTSAPATTTQTPVSWGMRFAPARCRIQPSPGMFCRLVIVTSGVSFIMSESSSSVAGRFREALA